MRKTISVNGRPVTIEALAGSDGIYEIQVEKMPWLHTDIQHYAILFDLLKDHIKAILLNAPDPIVSVSSLPAVSISGKDGQSIPVEIFENPAGGKEGFSVTVGGIPWFTSWSQLISAALYKLMGEHLAEYVEF